MKKISSLDLGEEDRCQTSRLTSLVFAGELPLVRGISRRRRTGPKAASGSRC